MSTPDAKGQKEPTPSEPIRFKDFVNFFKRYMNAFVVAALPIPVVALRVIPTYDAQRDFLTVSTSLFCFLTLAFIFYRRDTLAKLMFPDRLNPPKERRFGWQVVINWLPVFLIVLCFIFLVGYLQTFQISQFQAGKMETVYNGEVNINKIEWRLIPFSGVLAATFILSFLSAEAAFVLMATKEYLQDLLKIDEKQLLGA